jgi:signal peptidase I
MKRADRKKDRSGIRDYFELIAETALFVLFINTFVAQASQVPTSSMENTLLVGDFLFINRMAYAKPVFGIEKVLLPRKSPEKGDIVTFKFIRQGGQELVKRVIGTEGDTIEIADKCVLVNGKPLADKCAVHKDGVVIPKNESTYGEYAKRDNFGPITVPPGQLFVMGDNRDVSYDSRFWGCLPLSAVRGRPWILFFSYRAEDNVHLKQGLRDKLRRWTQYFPRARWGRLLHTIH